MSIVMVHKDIVSLLGIIWRGGVILNKVKWGDTNVFLQIYGCLKK